MRVALRRAPGALAAAARMESARKSAWMASAWMAAAQTASAHDALPAVPPAVAADSLPTLLVAFVLAAGGFAYLAGARRVPPHAWQRRALGAALAIGALSLLGPFERWAQPGAAAHMVQHMLLIAVVAPLAVLAQPWPQWQAALGAGARGAWRAVAPAARRPLVAAALHGALIWTWHTPRAYGLALDGPWWHVLEHASFALSAWLFWHAVLRAGPRGQAQALLALLLTSLHTGLLGALLTFARAPLYADAVSLADQQLAGLIMWVPGGGAYLAAATWCGQRWLRRLWRRRAPD
jgi:cytochrome c oxidase assembly factor CtaG